MRPERMGRGAKPAGARSRGGSFFTMVSGAALQSELDAAVQAARRAGQVLMDWSGRISVRFKAANDLVTEADSAAQETIQDLLFRRFPQDDFLGEEGIPKKPSAARRWIVDPLDGTTNYVHGFPFFCVSIGLEIDGRLAVGVVYDPVRKECFSGAAGAGATCNGVPLRQSSAAALTHSLLCVGLPADLARFPTAMQKVERVSWKARSIRRMGSAALSLAYVAAGRLDGYWSPFLHPWDAAAGVVLVREAGGKATTFSGREYSAASLELAASNGLLHAELLREIA